MKGHSGSEGRRLWPPALLFLLLWSGLAAWQAAEHVADARRHEAGLRRSAEAGLGILECSLRCMGPGRRERPDLLGGVLAEVISVPNIKGVWLTEPDGTPIASTGAERELPRPDAFPGALWSAGDVLVGRRADIGPCLFDGCGRRRSSEAVGRPTFLFLAVDRSEVTREIARDRRLRAAILAAAGVAALAGFLVVRARGRARRLRTELAVAEERSRRLHEWATLGAGLAHETRNPLSLVRGLAQGLAGDGARRIVDEVDRVVARINEFLLFSRPAEPRPERVELAPLFEEMAGLVEPDLAPRRGRIEIDAGPGAVLADRGMMRQVLLNLLVNAARVIPEEGRIRLAARSDGNGGVSVEVGDDGPGIPPEEIERVFEPYYTRTPGGTGLGLAIVRRLVEAHGGRVAIDSAPGRGTVVRITGLPGGTI